MPVSSPTDAPASPAALRRRLLHLLSADGVADPGGGFTQAIARPGSVAGARAAYLTWWRSAGRDEADSSAGRLHRWLGGETDPDLDAAQAGGAKLADLLGANELPPPGLTPDALSLPDDATPGEVQRAWMERLLLGDPPEPADEPGGARLDPGDVEGWAEWLALLAESPGHERRLDAEAAARIADYRGGGVEDPLGRTIAELRREEMLRRDGELTDADRRQRRWPMIVAFLILFLLWNVIFILF